MAALLTGSFHSTSGFDGFAALAKPGSADPKSQTEAYAADKPGWFASELSELKNHYLGQQIMGVGGSLHGSTRQATHQAHLDLQDQAIRQA